MAVGIDADLAARELHRAADLALAADQPVDHVALAPQDRQRGLLVELGAHALLDRQHLVEGEELQVVLLFLAPRQPTGQALALGQLGVLGGDLEHQGVDALAEGHDHDLVALLRGLQRIDQHDQRVRGTGVAEIGAQKIAHRALGDAADLGHLLGDGRHQAGHDEVGDLAALELAGGKRSLDGGRHDLRVALVADPALFPAIVEVALVAAEMVDEVHRHGVMAYELGDHVLGAAEQRRGAIAVVQLVGRGDLGHALVGRRDQGRAAAVLRGVEARDQRRGAGLLRAADVGGQEVLLDRERGADDAGVLAILEGMRRRGEVEAAHVGRLVAGQAIARGLDRHGDRILVPVGHRALALGEAAQAGGEPLVGVVDGLTVEAQARHIGPIGHDSDHCAFSSTL